MIGGADELASIRSISTGRMGGAAFRLSVEGVVIAAAECKSFQLLSTSNGQGKNSQSDSGSQAGIK